MSTKKDRTHTKQSLLKTKHQRGQLLNLRKDIITAEENPIPLISKQLFSHLIIPRLRQQVPLIQAVFCSEIDMQDGFPTCLPAGRRVWLAGMTIQAVFNQ